MLIDNNWIAQRIADYDIALYVFDAIDSTNNYLHTLQDRDKTAICIAEQQTHGKGSKGRTWHSPFGQNIYFSCAYLFEKNMDELSGLSLVVGLAILKTLRSVVPAQQIADLLRVKWPNDILYSNKKICGNLIELQKMSETDTRAIIGIGINVNMTMANDDAISQTWTSLSQLMHLNYDRNVIVVKLVQYLLAYLDEYKKSGLVKFIDEWHSADYLKGKNITLENAGKIIHGVGAGIDRHGRLLLSDSKGVTQAFAAGNTQLVK
jgi:BirA family biotin operon repressor/biotin-[acetyl-CoA-carboxylase] ligase